MVKSEMRKEQRAEGQRRKRENSCQLQIDRTELRDALSFPHRKPIDAMERHE